MQPQPQQQPQQVQAASQQQPSSAAAEQQHQHEPQQQPTVEETAPTGVEPNQQVFFDIPPEEDIGEDNRLIGRIHRL